MVIKPLQLKRKYRNMSSIMKCTRCWESGKVGFWQLLDSFCCTPEDNIILYINYNLIKNKMEEIKPENVILHKYLNF